VRLQELAKTQSQTFGGSPIGIAEMLRELETVRSPVFNDPQRVAQVVR
jgi:hypothetical protein